MNVRGSTIRLNDVQFHIDVRTMQENVRPVMVPRSRPSLQHVFISPKIKDNFANVKSRKDI